MSLGDRLSRWWAHRKLHRGRCEQCGRPLPDDRQGRGALYCSPECEERHLEERVAW